MREDRTVKFWDRMSKQFDKRAGLFNPPPTEKAKRYLKDRDTVLDFGCATGTVTNEIAGHVAKAVGIDLSPGMIDTARNKATELKIGNIDFIQAGIYDKTLENELFDTVLAFNILHFFTDTKEVLHRISALLKPEGILIIATACLKQPSFINYLQRLFLTPCMWCGAIPRMKYFSVSELNEQLNIDFLLITQENTSHHYFFVVRKKQAKATTYDQKTFS